MSAIELLPDRRHSVVMSRHATTARTTRVAYNCCRNRHCPKCQGPARAQWLADREADLLPVPYFHVVFTVPAASRGHRSTRTRRWSTTILFKAAAETLKTIAADPGTSGGETRRHRGYSIPGGRHLTHHPHVHCLVPGGGLSRRRPRWIASRPSFFLAIQRALAPLPPTVPRAAAGGVRRQAIALLRRSQRRSPIPAAFADASRRPLRADRLGRLCQASPSARLRRSSPISAATPTASPSPTAASLPSTTTTSPSAGATTVRQRRDQDHEA